jgi:hypothetical protein
MPNTITDAVNAIFRRLNGERLCEHCQQWAKKPHKSGDRYFCDNIHASIYYKKQQELMKQALEKKRELEKPRQPA